MITSSLSAERIRGWKETETTGTRTTRKYADDRPWIQPYVISAILMMYCDTAAKFYFEKLVLCEYSRFRIESNSYFSIRFEMSTTIGNFRILTVADFLLIYKFLVNRLPAKIPVTGCTFQLPICRVQHACDHVRHVFDLCRRSHQRQTPPSSLSAPHLCSGWGRGADAYTQSKYVQRLWPAENEIASQWHRR